ncbi:MAG TPA: AhpC/TSA family protein [Flavobacteriales bacterium]|nr:AhpC/TSA family protein [Flavobacteriales bacterium]HIN40167.1 AhpC/TSA family protein [Flavobacteriales bacterium]
MTKLNAFLKLLFLNIFVILYSCNSNIDGFIVVGKIDGVKNGKVFLAKLDLITNERIDVDSTEIKDGEFTFKGKIESPYLHTLFFNDNKDKIHLFLENSEITILGNIKDIESAKIIGSREDSLFHSYKIEDIFDRKKGMEIMIKNSDYAFAAFTAYYQFQFHNIQSDTLGIIMDGFNEPVKKSIYYEHLKNLYNTIKKVAISQPAPNFSVPDTTGNIIKLDDFNGKYVLVDFWASWCAPCRAANPKLIEVYNLFSDKNFTIIGISVDKNKNRWKKAIEFDKLPWINISNLKGWDKVSENYGVTAVPQNFLLDTNGIIIDKNIELEHLIDKLDKILSK